MGSTTFSGPVTSTDGFTTTGTVTAGTVTATTVNAAAIVTTSASVVSATASTLTVTAAAHAGRMVLLDRAAGIAVTLPAATGSGNIYSFALQTAVTSNTTTIKVADATDVMMGIAVFENDTDTSTSSYAPAATDDTITFNGSTTGGLKGAMVFAQDVAADLWLVRVLSSATGTEATPFSATV